jgi:hypothetical protein
MKKILAIIAVSFAMTGCASIQSIQSMIPSFWDDNQSRAIVDVRQSVAQLNCEEEHAPQVKRIKDNLQWFELYSESKGKRQQDVLRLVAPMKETVDDFYKRSTEKQGTKTYCEIKKKVMILQSDKAASAVLGRF